MRTPSFALAAAALAAAALAVVIASAGVAAADVGGNYDVKYEEVSTNCQSPLKYPHGKLQIKVKGTNVVIDIDRTPVMQGSVAKGGKISAKSKSGPTMIDGMNGAFSIAGKITAEGVLSLVMVGEYTANGKALCSQSWNVVGSKREGEDTKKPARKSLEVLPDLLAP